LVAVHDRFGPECIHSSVVSVLFSLISEMVLYGSSVIKLIFGFRELAAALAHVGSHRVTGIALPPVDATCLFSIVALAVWREHEI
jgi:hypothetical protein